MSEETRPKRTAVGAWITYDIANTVFWTGVVGLSFPLWLTKELSGDDATLGYTLAAAMTVVLVTAPIIGAISDQIGRKMPLLVAATLICIVATLLLGNGGLFISLALFALALASMELGAIFYNSLLHNVSTEDNRGMISGLGTGIGYLGSFIAVGVALGFTDSRGYVFVMQVVAFLFLLFALPIFFFLNEQRRQVLSSTVLVQVKQAFSQLGGNLRSIHRFPGLRRFLVARFLYGMGINTGVAFAVVYASETIGLSDREIQLILLAGISIAIPGGVVWGALADRIGPGRVLTISLFIWMTLFLFAVAIPWLSWPNHLYWVVGVLTGVAMPGVWTADRPYMLAFTPPQYLGEFFGLHGMVGKLGRVIGPFMWAFIAATLDLGQPVAVLSLVGCLVISYAILRGIKTPVRDTSTDMIEQQTRGGT